MGTDRVRMVRWRGSCAGWFCNGLHSFDQCLESGGGSGESKTGLAGISSASGGAALAASNSDNAIASVMLAAWLRSHCDQRDCPEFG